ncbi:NUDIX hydrolase [Undibacter mobilis]|uniref:NUDIX hydrolase n=1 Tax=Undibacter mobilis TaxID=2292256 RepID=A0A371B2R3_9BRAD|nr:NUDIX hydrolase [Undibacter mobilis]RDV01804.1 NUDIX hydrolase [Undibacter mobilis]
MGSNDGDRLLKRMSEMERDQSFPDSEPRDAATIMLIDRAGPQAKVLLGRRHHGHKFMPGKFVFPGGRIEAHDSAMTAVSELHPDTQAKLIARVGTPSREFARGMALAAVREMAEETGLLLGVKTDVPPQTPGEIWTEFAKASVHPDLGQLHFIARAITPPKRPKRFDTRFFTADATTIAHRIEGMVGPDSELVELVWAPIEEAAQFDMPTITSVVLEELAARVAAGMAHGLPVPFYHMGSDKFYRELL